MTRDNQHWVDPDYKQRMTVKEWRKILLDGQDKIIFRGRVMQLVADKLGHGVVDVRKEAQR